MVHICRESGIETKVQDFISNESQKKLLILSGEYGIGKTNLIEYIKEHLKNEHVLHFTVDKYCNSKNYLCNVMVEYLENMHYNEKQMHYPKNRKKQFFRFLQLASGFIPDVNYNPATGVWVSFRRVIPEFINFFKSGNINFTYEKKIVEIATANDLNIPTIGNLVLEILRLCDNAILYIIIDELDSIGYQEAEFINFLLTNYDKVCLIATSRSGLQKLPSTPNRLISPFIRQNHKTEYVLNPFNLVDTQKFIDEYSTTNKLQLEVNTEIANRVCEHTKGIPLFITAMCQNPKYYNTFSTNPSVLSNTDLMEEHYRFNICDLNATAKSVLYCIAANEGRMDLAAFDTKFPESLFREERTALFDRKILLCTKEKLICFQKEMFLNYILKHDSSYTDQYSLHLEKAYEAYKHTSNFKNIPDMLKSKAELVMKCNKNSDEQFNTIKSCCVGLIEEMKPDIANSILEKALIDSSLNTKQKNQLKCIQVQAEYYQGKMENVVKLYKDPTFMTIKDDVSFETWVLTLLHIAKAFYYLNLPQKTIDVINTLDNNEGNNCDLKEIQRVLYKYKLLKISALDLSGKYEECFSEFDITMQIAKETDPLLYAMFETVIQMRSNDFNDCIFHLSKAAYTLQETLHDNYVYAINNLGLEFLMNGDFKQAEKYLYEAKKEVNTVLEKHFIYNNLGLLYQYRDKPNKQAKHKDFDQARLYYDKALFYALSPLQKAYIKMNLAILCVETNDIDQAAALFKGAEEDVVVKNCPDPIAHSYFHHNYAKFLHIINEKQESGEAEKHCKESAKGISKNQLALLIQKRIDLAMELKITLDINCNKFLTNRRKFFAQCTWEPCELMFYN